MSRKYNAGKTTEINYTVSERFILSKGSKGYNTELRKISWNDGEEKWDLRKWTSLIDEEERDNMIEEGEILTSGIEEKFYKGFSFNDEEFMEIAKFFQSIDIEVEETDEEEDEIDGEEEEEE